MRLAEDFLKFCAGKGKKIRHDIFRSRIEETRCSVSSSDADAGHAGGFRCFHAREGIFEMRSIRKDPLAILEPP